MRIEKFRELDKAIEMYKLSLSPILSLISCITLYVFEDPGDSVVFGFLFFFAFLFLLLSPLVYITHLLFKDRILNQYNLKKKLPSYTFNTNLFLGDVVIGLTLLSTLFNSLSIFTIGTKSLFLFCLVATVILLFSFREKKDEDNYYRIYYSLLIYHTILNCIV